MSKQKVIPIDAKYKVIPVDAECRVVFPVPHNTDETMKNSTERFATYPYKDNNLVYAVMALAGEVGEVANECKKMLRDDNAVLTPERRDALIDELGDVLWYFYAIACELKVEVSEIANRNTTKLELREAKRIAAEEAVQLESASD